VATLSNTSSCSASFTYTDTVTVFVSNLMLTLNSQDIDCLSSNGGVAWANYSGGIVPIVCSWNTTPPTLNDSINNVQSGTYICSIIDSNNCMVEDSVTINLINPPYAGMDTNIVLCTKDTVNLFQFINNTPFTMGNWVPSLNGGYLGTFDPNINLSGIYYYIVSGNNFCMSDTSEITVIVVNSESILTPINDMCEGSECITLMALPVGGIWAGPGVNINNQFCPTISGVGNFVLTYTYTDTGCVFVNSISINVLPTPFLLPIEHN